MKKLRRTLKARIPVMAGRIQKMFPTPRDFPWQKWYSSIQALLKRENSVFLVSV